MTVLNGRWRIAVEGGRDQPILIGDSPVIERLQADVRMAARSDARVLITGETGVGKEVVAELIHRQCARQRCPFVAVNCAGLSDSLLESELFGHVRGSFTDAYRDKAGLARRADGGTLFLDEVGEMSPRMQGVLLRFVETGEIHPLGATQPDERVDIRIIAATNRKLEERIGTGDFREDLYYRLNVVSIAVPPLRERGRDVLLLFFHYLARACRGSGMATPTLTPIVEDLLLAYRWPGNVREVRNVAERVATHHHDGTIHPDMLPPEIVEACRPPDREQAALVAASSAAAHHPEADAAWREMVIQGRSFWAVVHPRFMSRELTKSDVREIVRRGLEQTEDSYKNLLELFHVPASDYKRFVTFLTQHDCHVASRR